ncbi:phosphatidylinositol 3 and 4-kinase-like protein [Sesbania bispinosa]|nr:phosphatidylinositol 3 and 4-kinase-like protein [Sesbania bispinosa]
MFTQLHSKLINPTIAKEMITPPSLPNYDNGHTTIPSKSESHEQTVPYLFHEHITLPSSLNYAYCATIVPP